MDAPRTREELKDELESITDQISEGIEKGKYTVSELQKALTEKTKAAAESTDKLVHENPWASIGIAVGLGLLIGLMMPKSK
ncbi:MAG: DUF883 family protein [Verrucomicrobiales bacterium]